MNAQYALLGILNEQPNYGYELKKMYDSLFGQDKAILTGQVYSTLSRLKRDKKIEEVTSDEESGGPDRVKYAITSQGEQALWKMATRHRISTTSATHILSACVI